MRRVRWPVFLGVALPAAIAVWLLLSRTTNPSTDRGTESTTGRAAPPSAADLASGGTLAGAQASGAPHPSATRPPAAPDDDPNATGPVRHVVLVGRVVDERRMPVASAQVDWICERLHATPARTDDQGRFRLEPIGRVGGWTWMRGTLRIESGSDRAAVQDVGVEPREGEPIDIGTYELRPAVDVDVHVRGATKGTAGGTRVELWASGEHRAMPQRWGDAEVDAAGDAHLTAVPIGWINVLARGTDGTLALASTEIGTDPDSRRIEVTLAPPRSLDVLVVTEGEVPVPVAGARVRASIEMYTGTHSVQVVPFTPGSPAAPTGLDGRTRLEGLVAGAGLRVAATSPLGAEYWEPKPDDPGVTLSISSGKPDPVSIPVEVGERAVPIEGTKLRIVSAVEEPDPAREREGRIEGGKIVIPDVTGIVRGVAVAPDGSIAPFGGDYETTEFAKPRQLVVRITQEGGAPVPGIDVFLWHEKSAAWSPRRRTGDDGRAVFAGLPPWKFVIHGFLTAGDDWGTEIGEGDVSAGDAAAEIVVGRERAVTVHVTVSGEPRLPSGLDWGIERGVVTTSEENPSAGEIRFHARPTGVDLKQGSIGIGGRGLRRVYVEFDWPPIGRSTSVEAALVATPDVIAVVRSEPGAHVHVMLERRDEETRAWRDVQGVDELTGSGRMTIQVSRVGQYRLRDLPTGVVSVPFDVGEGAHPIEATIDVSGLAVVRGRIEVPEGTKLDRVQVVIEGDGIDLGTGYGPGRRVSSDGGFEARVPAGRRFLVRPWHETLRPAAGEAGAIVVEAPRDGIVLRLVEGPRATIRIANLDPGDVAANAEIVGLSTLWVHAIAGKAGDWIGRDLVLRDDGSLSIAGLSAGETELWIDVPPWAPMHLESRTLVDGVTSLGEVRLERGSNVVIRAKSAKGKPPTDFSAFAERTEPPSIRREFVSGTDRDRWSIPGLCEGTWRLALGWTSPKGESKQLERTIEVDGHADLTIDVDTD